MEEKWRISGRIVSGVKQGAFFTQLDWFQEQCLDKLGFKPYAGTLNIEIASDDIPRVKVLEEEAKIEFIPPDSNFCSGKAHPVMVEHIPAAIVMPAGEVRIHGKNIVEIISDRRLKNALNLDDGDCVKLTNVLSAEPTQALKMKVDAVLFDLDGTLIDSIGIYYKIVDIVFDRLGLPPVPREAFVEAAKDGNFQWDSVLPENLQDRKIKVIEQATEITKEIYPRLFAKHLKLIPGAGKILEAISDEGMKIGIVTSTPEENMTYKRQMLKSAGIDKMIEIIITADDVKNKKPAAEPLIQCIRRLGVAPAKSVYVGDARIDIKAGKAAGMKTIGVLTGFDNLLALETENPDAILDSVRDLPLAIVMNSKLI